MKSSKLMLRGSWGNVWGLETETVNLSSLPRDTHAPVTVSSDVKQLLHEFRCLHEQRLRWLETDTTTTQVQLLKRKEDFLQSYVNDLTDQNQLLLQTVEELQVEADHNLSNAPMKLHNSDSLHHDLNLQLGNHLQHLRSDSNSMNQQPGHSHNHDVKTVSSESGLGIVKGGKMEERETLVKQLTQELDDLKEKMTERDECIRHLNQEVVGLRANEQHTQRLGHDNTQLTETVTSLQSKLQSGERKLMEVGETLDQTKNLLDEERRQKKQIHKQLHHSNKEVERLQRELTHVGRTAQKKMQRREVKIGLLVKELEERRRQATDCQKELLQKEEVWEKLHQEREELRAKMEEQSRECVHLNQTKERLEAGLALSHEELHSSHLEVRSRDHLILQLRDEMKRAELKHQETQEQVAALERELTCFSHKVRGHQEEACQLSKKVRDAERLKEQREKEEQRLHIRLRLSQQQMLTSEEKLRKQEDDLALLHQQLKDAGAELKAASLQIQEQKETVAIFKQKYMAAMEKVHKVQGQAEGLEEELKYSQQQLRESQLESHSLKQEQAELERRHQEKVGQWERSQEALDQLTDELQANQKLLREGRQREEDFRALVGAMQEEGERVRQQKMELERDLRLHRQSHSRPDEEFVGLQRHGQQLRKRCSEQVGRIAECEKTILQMKSELERQSQDKLDLKRSLALSHREHQSQRDRLEQEVTRLTERAARSALELAEAQKVGAALLGRAEEELEEARREAEAQREEARRLREEQEERARREKRSLSLEVEELRSQHRATAEELAARAEEVRRMEGCLREGKLAEEKIRATCVQQEVEVASLRRSLQQAVSQRLEAQTEKQVAWEQVDALRSEVEKTKSEKADLRRESKLVMANVNQWINEQKVSSESLGAQVKAQNKLLLLVTEEKEHLQQANDALTAEAKRLKQVADERERDAERFKALTQERGIRGDERTAENQSCVARNLGTIRQMQTRLRSNLEAIGMLNQQLNALSGENERLRTQLEEERCLRRRAQPPPPPPSSHLLPFSLSRARSRPLEPGESRAASGPASLGDGRSGRASGDLTK